MPARARRCVYECRENPGPAGAERMPERDCPAVDVDARRIEPQLPDGSEAIPGSELHGSAGPVDPRLGTGRVLSVHGRLDHGPGQYIRSSRRRSSGGRGGSLTPPTRTNKLRARNGPGQVAEWLKAHAWRACKRQKRFEGSNPSLSAAAAVFSLFCSAALLTPDHAGNVGQPAGAPDAPRPLSHHAYPG